MRNKEKRNGGEGRGWGEGEAQQDEETNKTVSSLREERDFLNSKKKKLLLDFILPRASGSFCFLRLIVVFKDFGTGVVLKILSHSTLNLTLNIV